jgi:hypothetical protein
MERHRACMRFAAHLDDGRFVPENTEFSTECFHVFVRDLLKKAQAKQGQGRGQGRRSARR